jgi:acetamidase/formamidase
MGVAPLPAMGRISSAPPGVHTGNIDNKDIRAGTTLYMPVYAPGALFSVGDGHAAQGQCEVDLSAIETGLRGPLPTAGLVGEARPAHLLLTASGMMDDFGEGSPRCQQISYRI